MGRREDLVLDNMLELGLQYSTWAPAACLRCQSGRRCGRPSGTGGTASCGPGPGTTAWRTRPRARCSLAVEADGQGQDDVQGQWMVPLPGAGGQGRMEFQVPGRGGWSSH